MGQKEDATPGRFCPEAEAAFYQTQCFVEVGDFDAA
jgi:hypothetical protein